MRNFYDLVRNSIELIVEELHLIRTLEDKLVAACRVVFYYRIIVEDSALPAESGKLVSKQKTV